MATSIEQKILEQQHALENAMGYPEIQKRLNRVSYDRKTLLQGKRLNERVRRLQTAKKDNYGSQATATDLLAKNTTHIRQLYREHVVLARLAFKDDRGMQIKLDIIGARQRSQSGWLSQAITFYEKVDEIAPAMAGYGVTLEILQQTRDTVKTLSATRQQQMQRKAEAQNATEQRDIALKEMNAWMKDFRAAARLAIKDNPQWLEMLGIKVPNKVK